MPLTSSTLKLSDECVHRHADDRSDSESERASNANADGCAHECALAAPDALPIVGADNDANPSRLHSLPRDLRLALRRKSQPSVELNIRAPASGKYPSTNKGTSPTISPTMQMPTLIYSASVDPIELQSTTNQMVCGVIAKHLIDYVGYNLQACGQIERSRRRK